MAQNSATQYLCRNICQEPLEDRKEVVRLLPHGAVLATDDLDGLAAPEVPVLETLDHVVVEMRLIGADDNSSRHLGLGNQLLLVGAVTKAEVLEQDPARLVVRPDGGVGHPLLEGPAGADLGEHGQVLVGEVLAHVPPGALVVEGLVPEAHQHRADHHQPLGAGEQRQHLGADVPAQRPADHNNLLNLKLLQDLDGRLCIARHRVGALRVRSVGGLAVSREVERQDSAREWDLALEYMTEDVRARGVAVDAEDRRQAARAF